MVVIRTLFFISAIGLIYFWAADNFLGMIEVSSSILLLIFNAAILLTLE